MVEFIINMGQWHPFLYKIGYFEKINSKTTNITLKYSKMSQNGDIYGQFEAMYQIRYYIVIFGYKFKK